jgi:hypothetical protein
MTKRQFTEKEIKGFAHRKHLFVQEQIARDAGLGGLDTRLAIRLAKWQDIRTGDAYPSYDTLANELGASKRNVIRSAQKLGARGNIGIDRRGGRKVGSKDGETNRFKLILKPSTEQAVKGDAYDTRLLKRLHKGLRVSRFGPPKRVTLFFFAASRR